MLCRVATQVDPPQDVNQFSIDKKTTDLQLYFALIRSKKQLYATLFEIPPKGIPIFGKIWQNDFELIQNLNCVSCPSSQVMCTSTG